MIEYLKTPYRNFLLLGLVIFIITSITSKGFLHPDEHFQILEFAHYKSGNSSSAELAWEFNEKIRPCLQPYVAVGIIRTCTFFGIKNPFTQAFVFRLLMALASWLVITRTAFMLLDSFKTEHTRKMFLGLSFFLWFIPHSHVRFSSEIASGLVFLLALWPFLKKEKKPAFVYLLSGFLMGVAFYFRFQIALAFVGVFIWLLINKTKLSSLLYLFFGGIISIGFGFLIDVSFYGSIEFTPWNYFKVNILEGKAAEFGVSPFWGYVSMMFTQLVPPLGIALVLTLGLGLSKLYKSLLGLVFISFFFFHSLVGHKEIRFLLPVCFAMVYTVSVGYEIVYARYSKFRVFSIAVNVLIVTNFFLLAYRTFVPRELMNFQKYVYKLTDDNEATIVSVQDNMYNILNYEMNFYKSPNAEMVILQSFEEVDEYLLNNSQKKLYLFHSKLNFEKEFEGFELRREYTALPDWILKYNINNWQDRTRMWSLYEVVPDN